MYFHEFSINTYFLVVFVCNSGSSSVILVMCIQIQSLQNVLYYQHLSAVSSFVIAYIISKKLLTHQHDNGIYKTLSATLRHYKTFSLHPLS